MRKIDREQVQNFPKIRFQRATTEGIKVAKGYEVDIIPEYSFALWYCLQYKNWCVIERSTGLAVAKDCYTPNDAIFSAKYNFIRDGSFLKAEIEEKPLKYFRIMNEKPTWDMRNCNCFVV